MTPVKTLLGPWNQENVDILAPKIPRGKQPKYLYKTWDNIKQRITNTNHQDYSRYGGRGIGMYAPWYEGYEAFKSYVLQELGERPENYSLDRIDNDRGYEPGNLRWATAKEQANNRLQVNRYTAKKPEHVATNTATQNSTENVAAYLVDKFKSPEYRPLFLKVAWRIDKGTIDRLVATSFELGKNPRAYFITLVKREKGYNG